MEELSSKMRNQVKKSLKIYDMEMISPDEFRRIGLFIYNSAQEKYRVKTSLTTQEKINRMVENANKSDCKIDIGAVYSKEDWNYIATKLLFRYRPYFILKSIIQIVFYSSKVTNMIPKLLLSIENLVFVRHS